MSKIEKETQRQRKKRETGKKKKSGVGRIFLVLLHISVETPFVPSSFQDE